MTVPLLSVAFAVSVCVPMAGLAQLTVYGLWLRVPITVVPSRKVTEAIVALPATLAVSGTVTGSAVNRV